MKNGYSINNGQSFESDGNKKKKLKAQKILV